MAFTPWHDHKSLINTATEVWQQEKSSANLQAIRKAVNNALDTKYVKEKGDLLIEMNDHGIAYSAMDQADMGLALIETGQAIGDKAYIKLGRKALNVLLTDVKKGGLRKDTGSNSWFHGQTSRSNKFPGGTLNKHLSATRDLIIAGNLLGNLGSDYRKAGIEGIRQISSGNYPSLEDFLVKKKGKPVDDSWWYYAVNPKSKKMYFLSNGEKNAVYHVFCLNLIRQIHNLLGSSFPLGQFNNQKASGKSIVRRGFDTYMLKASQGLYTNAKVPDGNFSGLPEWRKPLNAGDISYFQSNYQ